MIYIEKMKTKDAQIYARIAAAAYREEPWGEQNDLEKLRIYCENFISSETRPGYILLEDNEIVGAALCILIPSLDGCYVRIEDFCILPERQRKGMGTAFVELLKEQVKAAGADSILLGTQRDFPSHRFYLKKGFNEVETAILLYREV